MYRDLRRQYYWSGMKRHVGVHKVFHVSMLQKYTIDPTHEVDWGLLLTLMGPSRTQYGPHILSYLRTKVCGLIFGFRILLHMHVFVCASMCEFRGQNSVKGGRM